MQDLYVPHAHMCCRAASSCPVSPSNQLWCTQAGASRQRWSDASVHAAAPGLRRISSLASSITSEDDIVLGPLLGRGSFGRVYAGMSHGRRVAVKVSSRSCPRPGLG